MPISFPDKPLDILVVAPHPDDAEISVSGTILKSLADGQTVGVLDLTSGEPTPNGTLARRYTILTLSNWLMLTAFPIHGSTRWAFMAARC